MSNCIDNHMSECYDTRASSALETTTNEGGRKSNEDVVRRFDVFISVGAGMVAGIIRGPDQRQHKGSVRRTAAGCRDQGNADGHRLQQLALKYTF